MRNSLDRPGPKERVCYNCKHMLWMVGIGLGVRCGYEIDGNKSMKVLPSLRHVCDKFEWKHEQPKPEGATTTERGD